VTANGIPSVLLSDILSFTFFGSLRRRRRRAERPLPGAALLEDLVREKKGPFFLEEREKSPPRPTCSFFSLGKNLFDMGGSVCFLCFRNGLLPAWVELR